MHLSFRNKCWIELETVEKAMKFVYANENHSTMINEKNGVVFLTFPKLVKAGVCHGFSTRIGGVSAVSYTHLDVYKRQHRKREQTQVF